MLSLTGCEPATPPEGGPMFLARQDIQQRGCAEGVATGDFNNDGKIDIAAAAGDVGVFLGNGDGTFREGRAIPVAGIPLWVEAAHLNGDRNLDLAVTITTSARPALERSQGM